MQITGKLIKKYDTQVVSDKFQKREFVVEYAEKPEYPMLIKLELIRDKVNLIDKLEIGTTINVSFNLKGRKWVNKQGEEVFFNTLQAWKIDPMEVGKAIAEIQAQSDLKVEDGDDLPF